MMVLLALVMMVAAGCVTTTECDEYVRCGDGEICYKRQCLPQCTDDAQCEAPAQCVPCQPESGALEGDCLGEAGRVCVEPG
ncbi:hypothetical protein FRC96_10575 [Lujinxingia vulgaris]|uniref:Uncharacterized protein n=1 Tax=Lujinxingia vulgaris TaxID=2600176 RepID=A0A5C6X5Z8_9DELT|nr:hypothetical protein [Lujinxingia vulgaris]TXD35709.1 hypothetical protein FRC96_10575 [Lujinxingia vulgaris]